MPGIEPACSITLTSGVDAHNPLRGCANTVTVNNGIEGFLYMASNSLSNGTASITLVAHAQGVDFLLEGAKDRNGNPFDVSSWLCHERAARTAAKGVSADPIISLVRGTSHGP